MRKLFKFSLHKQNENLINSKKNSCRGNYMRKYGSLKKIHVNKGLQHTVGEMALIMFQFTTLSCAKGSKRKEKWPEIQ